MSSGRGVGAGVVADDHVAARAAARGELLQLQREQPAVLTQLQDILCDFLGNAPDHFLALQGDSHIPDGDHGLDFEGRQGAGDLVQAGAVAFEGCESLVGAGQDLLGALQHVPQAVDVEGDDLHGLADRNHRNSGLDGHALGRPVTRS